MAEILSRLVFDIETLPTSDLQRIEHIRRYEMERRPAQNTAKEIKTAWDTSEGRETRIMEAYKNTAVNVLWAEVLCVGAIADEQERALFGLRGIPEWQVLEETAEFLEERCGKETIWIGHNVHFDLAVLLNRFRRHAIQPPKHFPVYVDGRWRGRVFDTMRRTPCQNGMGYVSLSEVCAAYGLPEAKSVPFNGAVMEGSRVLEAATVEAWDLLQEYCLADVDATLALYLCQTASETWGALGLEDELRGQVREIMESGLDDTAKRLAAFSLLEAAGRVPR